MIHMNREEKILNQAESLTRTEREKWLHLKQKNLEMIYCITG